MPIGYTQPGEVTSPVGPPPASVTQAAQSRATNVNHPEQVGAGPLDLWQHYTLPASVLPRVIRVAIPATKIVLLEQDFERVYLTRGREASEAVGAYDLIHPGGGFLEFAIPPTTDLGIKYADGAAPTLPLELWLLAGPSAVR